MCVCDLEDSGDSLLKQYNGHLSPRGVIQIQYQARTFSTPLSALRRGHSVYCCSGLKEKPGGQRHMHPVNQSVSQSGRPVKDGWKEGRKTRPSVWSVRSPHISCPVAAFCQYPTLLAGGHLERSSEIRENARRGN